MRGIADRIILLTGWRRSLLAFVAGAFAVLGQAPYDFPAACFVSFPVLVWLLDGAAASSASGWFRRLKAPFAAGCWFGLGYFLFGVWWIGSALLVEADSFAWALPFAVLGIPALLALFYGLAAALARVLWSDGVGKIFALAFGFGLAEALRGVVLTGFPWNAIGYAAMPTPLLMQSVDIVSLVGMNTLAVFVFCVPALLPYGRAGVTGLILAAGLLTAHVGYGFYRISAPAQESGDRLAVRIVQPNVDLSEKWDSVVRDRIFRSMLELSSRPPADGKQPPQLIVWPETSVPYVLSESPAALAAIGEMLKDGQSLLAGVVREEGASVDGGRYYNSIVQIDYLGQIVDAMDKVHLVPFGEYLPLEETFAHFGIRQFVSGPMNFAAGTERHALRVGAALLLPYICYEVIFPGLMPPAGSADNVLVNLTNDAWFGDTPGPYQHLRQAQLRSVEVRKPMLRAANTGISAVIDHYGRISAGLSLGTQGIIDETIQLPAKASASNTVDRNFVGLMVVCVAALLAFGTRIFTSHSRIAHLHTN